MHLQHGFQVFHFSLKVFLMLDLVLQYLGQWPMRLPDHLPAGRIQQRAVGHNRIARRRYSAQHFFDERIIRRFVAAIGMLIPICRLGDRHPAQLQGCAPASMSACRSSSVACWSQTMTTASFIGHLTTLARPIPVLVISQPFISKTLFSTCTSCVTSISGYFSALGYPWYYPFLDVFSLTAIIGFLQQTNWPPPTSSTWTTLPQTRQQRQTSPTF